MKPIEERLAGAITHAAIAEGKIIEVGWEAFRALANVPDNRLAGSRAAFFAGALHLFQSIMFALDPDAEPTDADLARMEAIHGELEKWPRVIEMVTGRPKGSA